MSQGPTPEQAEERLRQALWARAGDMAPGDGAAWDLDPPRPGILPFAVAGEPRRSFRWRTVLGAVAALAIPVAGGAVLLADDTETPIPAQVPPCTDGTTTTDVLDLTVPPANPAGDPTASSVSILPLQGGPSTTTGAGPTITGPPPTQHQPTSTAPVIPDPPASTTTSVSLPETDTTASSIPGPPTTTDPPVTPTTTTEPCEPTTTPTPP